MSVSGLFREDPECPLFEHSMSSVAFVRSSVWFDDGNLVVRADRCLSRVYAGMLAANSPVLASMVVLLLNPETVDGQDLLYGCPVLDMTEDPTDVESFLLALFDPEFIADHGALKSLPTVISILRISRRYFVCFLLRWGLAELDSLYPVHLKGWDRRDGSHMILSEHVSVIELAKELRMSWLLPSAYLSTFISSLDIISSPDDPLVCFVPMDVGFMLDAVDYGLISRASANVMYGATFILNGMRAISYDACPHRGSCVAPIRDMIEEVQDVVYPDPMALLSSLEHWSPVRRLVCGPCGHELRSAWKTRRACIWEMLPQMFALAAWGDLELDRLGWMEFIEGELTT
ncbi:hypothetical protein C8J57DRAFT_1712003 [Mycena rebaudengoi]|nr:hypothetical protein C8J57DRAFT_1730639 [Mycena rebaudengoi]KAJ7279908.1 hypothetical protein C8J57DRAFT_1712003 [Mycena rebaudengoi]